MGHIARVVALPFGLLVGAGGALLIEYTSPRPLLLAAVAAMIVVMTAGQVHRRMSTFERGHDARAEALRVAMLTEHAPHLLAAQHHTR